MYTLSTIQTNLSAVLQFCFNKLEKPGRWTSATEVVRIRLLPWSWRGIHRWCNISYHPFAPLSLPLLLIILFLFFSLPSAISLDRIAPWPQAPVAMWRCILSPTPTLSFFFYSDFLGVEVVWLMPSNPISQCSLPSPAGGFSHAIHPDQSERPTVSETENTFPNHRIIF